MSDPHSRPPATPPPLPPDGATGEWSAATAAEKSAPAAPDVATVTSAGQPAVGPGGEPQIPNPFGRYTVLRLLGRGGMGAVFLAHDAQLDRPVALKIPTFRGALTGAQKERFLREARSIAALRHANLCPVFDAGEESGILYLTMAYIDGQPLAALVERGPVAAEKAVDLVRRVARAMHAAHAHGTVHRDLKPANILIDKAGEPVVMDFGLARRAQWADDPRADGTTAADAGLTQFGSVIGTPAYMPPEQARGDVAAIGPRSDVYSLGVILYELLTGRRPFTGTDTADLIRKIENDPPPRMTEFYPWLDRNLEAACLKALAKDPADRFDTMAAFEQALKDAVDPELRVVLPPPLPSEARGRSRRTRRHPLKTLAWVGIILTLIVGICVGIPTLAVRWLIGQASDKFREITQAQREADTEWETIQNFWQPPPADAGPDVLFPPAFGDGKYRRVRHEEAEADTELGISLPGHRGVYRGPDGDEVEINAYRCPEAEAKKIQQGVASLAAGRQSGTATAPPGSRRTKAVYVADDSRRQTVTFGFHDELSQNQEYGKLWHSHGWLFWFKTTVPLRIEHFPPKYLMEVWKKTSAPPKAPDPPKVMKKGK